MLGPTKPGRLDQPFAVSVEGLVPATTLPVEKRASWMRGCRFLW